LVKTLYGYVMSEKPSPNSDEPRGKSGNTVKLALLAGILGLAVGAGLYAFSDKIGNVENGAASEVAGLDGTCRVDDALRSRLDSAAGGDMAAFKALDRPASVTDLAFMDASGQPRTLGDWGGKTVLFNLWATWCAPCRAEMPSLDALQGELGGEKFEVVPVSVDLGTPDKPKKFYSDIGMKHAGFFHDGELETLNELKKNSLAFGLPATLLIDQRGCVLGTLNGPAEWAGEDAKRLIATALQFQSN
jgi:thiol-disulfide isomerase/thioredoxin